MAPKRAAGQASQAEVSLLPSLQKCLVNLPASLVQLLVNANTLPQNVVIELSYRQPLPSNASTGNAPSTAPRSIFLGWTGMQSVRKLAAVVGRDGLSGSRGNTAGREQEVPVVEVDATLGRLLGLGDGQKVGISLHLDPPEAHTINIEPLTPADWEMIELHATFLETNFLSQVRALPNPSYSPSSDDARQPPHPVTLHLTPTSFANIVVTSLSPPPQNSSPFVKISRDAEVIVAPKTRQRAERGSGHENRSVTSAGRRSAGGKSGTSTVRHRRDKEISRGTVFLRGVDRALCGEWFDEDGGQEEGLRVWVDRDALLNKALKGVTWVTVSVVKPAGLQEPVDPQKEPATEKPASKVVARIGTWEDAPDSQHVAISTMLCQVLGAESLAGGLVRLEAAPQQAPKASKLQSSKEHKESAPKESGPRTLKIHPFSATGVQADSGLKFGGESKQEQEEAARQLRTILGKGPHGNGILDGPLTDGMMLPTISTSEAWPGGILKFDPAPPVSSDPTKTTACWVLASERKLSLEVQPEVIRPTAAMKGWNPGVPLPQTIPTMVGIDPLIEQLASHLTHSSSVLLAGGLGAGKTNLTHLLAHRLRSEYLTHIIYFPCRTLVTDETRVSAIKENLDRLFASAAWGARLGGRSVVVLDDLDRLCPVETELQVGNENGRSRHVSEAICSVVRQYCSVDSGVVLLATAQSKEALNNVIVGGHVVREIVSLKAPNKEGRRKVLEMLVQSDNTPGMSNGVSSGAKGTNGGTVNGTSWHDSTSASSRPNTSSGQSIGFSVDKNIDFLDLAGQTDGYMPGDLVLLASRARSEALIRSVSWSYHTSSDESSIILKREDFAAALKGFTPASLRNVTLQSSTTSWSSIGGLHATRKILLETLQYPTTYAPIFAHCPLRLRSGLLLYGYPGCGKTLLASAVANECGLNFISVKGPEILNKYIGASEKSVRDLFERAEAAKPCVLFFDEFDSIAPKRGHDSTGVTDRVVNQLLTQMDGAEGLSGVYVLAATSRPDLIDPALLRPGRLDKSIICDLPSYDDRVDILSALGRKVHFSEEIATDEGRGSDARGLREIARRTEGYSGADLQAVVYNAQLEAIHDFLGDSDGDTDVMGQMKSKKTNGYSGSKESRGIPDFSHFLLGDKDAEDTAKTSSTALTERAKIATKIGNLQALRKKQKELQQQMYPQRSSSQSAHSRSNSDGQRDEGYRIDEDDNHASGEEKQNGEPASKEPHISWRHISKSLETTRASISREERRRLAGIYKEFIVGRNGEMPSGQGGSEIGGRTSLM